jgi:hypothetical protein
MPSKSSKKPRSKATSKEMSRVLVLMERMEEQNRATYEAVMAVEGRILGAINPRLDKIELRLDALEIAVRQNSEDIKRNSEDIKRNSEDIKALRLEVERLNTLLRVEADENVIQSLERRVRALEERVGI